MQGTYLKKHIKLRKHNKYSIAIVQIQIEIIFFRHCQSKKL